ncbi:MAG TPA: hypothetical protein VF816_15610 [Rhodocyclaceae bacterium]
MATVPSSSVSAAAQYGLDQLRLQQTRLAAQRAEQTAQALQAEAANARQDAFRARDRAQKLESESSQASSEASRLRQGMTLLQSTGQLHAQQQRAVSNARITSTTVVEQQSGTSSTSRTPVVNAQGQVTGRVLSTTA